MLIVGIAISHVMASAPKYYEGVPNRRDVIAIEESLRKRACLRPFSSWARHYAYGSYHGKINYNIIEVKFKRFYHHEEAPGIYLDKVPMGAIEIDDRPMDFRVALYNLRTKRVKLFLCNKNDPVDLRGFVTDRDADIRPRS